MKRVRVSPGKFVVVSQGMADKAARVFASGAFTRDQVREMASAEPKGASGVFLGKATAKRAGAVSGKTGAFVRQTTGHVVVAGANQVPTKRKAA
ncbi:MAG TPA: hypothetical protein PK306_04845 [Aquabacterium sp.]|jgi:hypothetical protein|nr:hypothetical protein [Aquabacterium sp.]